MRRKASLSDADIAVWAAVAASVKPLPGRNRPAQAAPVAHAPVKHQPPPAAPSSKTSMTTKITQAVLATTMAMPSAAPGPKPLVALERRLKQRLRRGQEDIGGVLDLHGMRQNEAHRSLLMFVQRKFHDGATVLLVITGKGSISPQGEERGLLRRMVPHWLSDPGLRRCVLGFENAADGHGGSGALYVRLRKRRGD